jgi:hypothetical protein
MGAMGAVGTPFSAPGVSRDHPDNYVEYNFQALSCRIKAGIGTRMVYGSVHFYRRAGGVEWQTR